MVPADDDAGLGRHAVVQDAVVLEHVAVGAHGLALVAEEHAGLAIAHNSVAAEQVIRILVPDGDALALVPLDLVVLEQPVLDAPADEQAVLPVAGRAIAPDDRALRAAAGMQPVTGVVLQAAVFHNHPLRHLEADAVAVVAADRAVADRHILALEQVDPAAAAAVERLGLFAV